MSELPDQSIDLIVTSPPYPMIEMWDEIFAQSNEKILVALSEGRGNQAFELIHQQLDLIWNECSRVLKDGGLFCINIGDATRKVNGSFQLFPNHSRIIESLQSLGFCELPSILWRKPTNSPNKFMGSGMLPSNAYVTLEHEYILIFRKGQIRRKFKPKLKERYQSAYFWEERNQWFSDIWLDLKGIGQIIPKKTSDSETGIRERSAAFPFQLPYRLINMFSIYGDTVLDPFWGTGTTTLAAMVAGRNSRGYELNSSFLDLFQQELSSLSDISSKIIHDRIENHLQFIRERKKLELPCKYQSDNYGFDVMTKQESSILFYLIAGFEVDKSQISVNYMPVKEWKTFSENHQGKKRQSKLFE